MGNERRLLSYEVDWSYAGDQLTLVLKQLTPMVIANEAPRPGKRRQRRRSGRPKA